MGTLRSHGTNACAVCVVRAVTFPTFDYAVTLDAKQIYVVKRATVDAQE